SRPPAPRRPAPWLRRERPSAGRPVPQPPNLMLVSGNPSLPLLSLVFFVAQRTVFQLFRKQEEAVSTFFRGIVRCDRGEQLRQGPDFPARLIPACFANCG